jgi:hypothetical protein
LEGVVFSISSFVEDEKEANVLKIEIYSKLFATKKGLTIGNTKIMAQKLYGTPDRIRGNNYHYMNREYDHLDMIISFDQDEIITRVELVAGT